MDWRNVISVHLYLLIKGLYALCTEKHSAEAPDE
jgi:hypothetical protein